MADKERARHTGAKTRYNREWHVARADAWAKAGLLDKEIADELGISRRTYYYWRETHPEFDKAIEDGKRSADKQVEGALFKRALGYETIEREYSGDIDPATGKEKLKKIIEIGRAHV